MAGLLHNEVAERFALCDPLERELDRFARLADRLSAHHQPLVLQILDERIEAAILFAQQILGRHEAILEHQLGGVAREPAVLFERPRDAKARRALFDDEHRDLPVAARIAGLRGDEVDIAVARRW